MSWELGLFIVLLLAGGFIAEKGDKNQDPGLMIAGIVILIVVIGGGLWLL